MGFNLAFKGLNLD